MARAIGALLALLALPLAGPAQAETIRGFETEIHLEGDDAFRVVERIRYDFGSARRHGIFREIPVAYGRGRAADYRISVDVLSVTDARGSEHPYRVSRAGRKLRIRIGDPDATVQGVQEYWIRYRVERGILYFQDHDEIYWNATGTDWTVPIEAARAVVLLPDGAGSDEVARACFTGPQGAIASDCVAHASPDMISFGVTRPLGAGEGLTVVVGLPKGILDEPSRLQRLLSRASDHLSGWFLLPLGALAGMWALWRERGRDPGGRDAIAVRYEPPEGLTPAEVGTVLDERVDLADISASILDLAVRGYLEIEEVQTEKFLFLTDRDYVLRKRREPSDVRPHEAILMTRLFEDGDEVRISSLKNRFHTHLPAIRDALYAALSRERRFFPTSPEKVRRAWALGGALLAAAGVAGLAMELLPAAAGPLLAAGLVVLGFSRFMPRRTRRGRAVYEEILGLKEFIERVDADRLRRTGAVTAERFERLLPFALVLGVADAWADAFAGIYTQPPRWYRSPRHASDFAPRRFVGDLGRSLDTMGQTLGSTPRRGGSGASGLGGGGFSGGGFGGGGGGSW